MTAAGVAEIAAVTCAVTVEGRLHRRRRHGVLQ
jgi:hypothetical protein